MVDRLITEEARMGGLGTSSKQELVISLSKDDIPHLSSEAAGRRIEAAIAEGATAFYGDLRKLRLARQLDPQRHVPGGILQVTNPLFDFRDDEGGVGSRVVEAVSCRYDAVAISHFFPGSSEIQDQELMLAREAVARSGADGALPVVVSLYSYNGPTERQLVRAMGEVSRQETGRGSGADALIVDSTAHNAAILEQARVPAAARLGHWRTSYPLRIFRDVATARDAGASVVIGNLKYVQDNGDKSFQPVLAGVKSVLDGATPEAAKNALTQTRKRF